MITTPYYLIDEKKLLKNMEIIQRVRERCGARSLLALKCFSTWGVFPLMRKYMDGTTSSSLYEAQLGHEEFGGETHAYSVAYPDKEVAKLVKFADKIIFNSASQLEKFYEISKVRKIGVRVNPGISYSGFDLADPARKYSRLGIVGMETLRRVLPLVSGLMFHFNCENNDFANFATSLDFIGEKFSVILKHVEWVSLGGGIFFTKKGYPLADFCRKLKEFSDKYGVQIYLEPGESSITNSAELVTEVVDVVRNKIDIAIVDASIEAHMLDLLIYRLPAKIASPAPGNNKIMIAGRSCLAGDVFGNYKLSKKLKLGDEVRFADAAGYTMVKKNWFNGMPMPSIAVRRLNGRIELVKMFGYLDFKNNLS